METMDELLDNIITDDSPSQISDAIKDMLYAKTAERVNSYRQTAADSLFNGNSEEDNSPESIESED
jgi:hypothetical protein